MRHPLDRPVASEQKELLGADAAAVVTARSAVESDAATARHTPGPWKVERIPEDARWDLDLSIENGDAFWIVDERVVDEVLATVHETSRKEVKANAHLIAAAPEMKEGLLKAIEALEDTAAQASLAAHHTAALPHQREWLRNEVRAIADAAIKALRELIAKAEGRS